MQRVMAKCHDPRLTSRAFYAQANLLDRGPAEHVGTFLRKDEGVL